MELILELNDSSVGLKAYKYHDRHFLLRRSVRGVLLDGLGKVYFMHLKKRGIYKIPGGGVEEGESLEEALKREVMEEAGVDFEIVKELGIVTEQRYYEKDKTGLLQITYAYLIKLKGEYISTNFTEKEKRQGAISIWIEKENAINLVKGYELVDYEANFIKAREVKILEEASRYW